MRVLKLSYLVFSQTRHVEISECTTTATRRKRATAASMPSKPVPTYLHGSATTTEVFGCGDATERTSAVEVRIFCLLRTQKRRCMSEEAIDFSDVFDVYASETRVVEWQYS